MSTAHQTHVAFHATGQRLGGDLEPIAGLDLRPALLARHRDLTTLRYDFPVVLVSGTADGWVRSLSGLMDDVIGALAQDDGAARMARDVLKVEQRIRALAAQGHRGRLTALWDEAVERLGEKGNSRLRDSLDRARAALPIDGDVVDCDREWPRRLLEHAWRHANAQKAARFRDRVSRLASQLRELLRGDFARSQAGRGADQLKRAFGDAHEAAFDFGAMSRLLVAAPAAAMSDSRRRRIEALVAALESQRVYPAPGEPDDAFVFESCAAALDAYRTRLPTLVDLSRSLAMAELEVAGSYDESKHDALFARFGDREPPLDADELAIFPDYFVSVDAATMDPAEPRALLEVLSAGLPVKVLLEADLLTAPLASMAMALATAFVFQSPASHLYQLRHQVAAGLAYQGPSLFSVFAGAASDEARLPPYLVAAAALESRAFPAFTYDPGAGSDWAARFDLSANPQPDQDWPQHRFDYEDRGHQRASLEVAFTFADFAACDSRYARHLALVPQAAWSEDLTSVGEWLALDSARGSLAVPSLLMVDRDNRLQHVLADETVLRETRQCRDRWHSLQELGGIHNSHAARLLARTPPAAAADPVTPEAAGERAAVAAAPAAAPTAAGTAPEPVSADAVQSPDDPYIETPRCSTCNECTQINNRMFAYNENRQAYVADAGAGTYRQLVEAAESCQVSIIHPGKPRDPNEPGLDELVERAQPFL